jgi:hypothetical protein
VVLDEECDSVEGVESVGEDLNVEEQLRSEDLDERDMSNLEVSDMLQDDP